MDEAFRILDDGRVFFDYGPASMVVTARRGDEDLSELAASAFPFLRDSLAEIAGALGQSLPQVTSRLFRARKRLKRMLEEAEA